MVGASTLALFSAAGRPLAVAEYKWFWNSIEKDAKAVAGVATQLTRPPRGFVVVMGAVGPKYLDPDVEVDASRAILTMQRSTMKSRLKARLKKRVQDVGAAGVAYSKVIECRVVEPGTADTWAYFQAVIGELGVTHRQKAAK